MAPLRYARRHRKTFGFPAQQLHILSASIQIKSDPIQIEPTPASKQDPKTTLH